MAGTILKRIGVIKSVSPKVKNPKTSKIKGEMAKTIGQTRRYQEESEEIMDRNLKKAQEGNEDIYGTVEKNKKDIEELRARKKKFPSKMMRDIDEGLKFEVTPEYKKGGLVKKGIPKLAKKGWK
jgi:hypothetical protein